MPNIKGESKAFEPNLHPSLCSSSVLEEKHRHTNWHSGQKTNRKANRGGGDATKTKVHVLFAMRPVKLRSTVKVIVHFRHILKFQPKTEYILQICRQIVTEQLRENSGVNRI